MIDVLIQGDILFTGEEIIKDGYVYVKNGIVEDFGSGVPPEDYTFAMLIVGGPGRFIGPALLGAIDPLSYMFKRASCKPAREWDCNKRRRLSPEEEVLLSLPAIQEAHTVGIGRLFLVASRVSSIVNIAEKIGGSYGALILDECDEIVPHPRLESVRRAEESGVVPWICPLRDLCRSSNPYRESAELARKLGVEPPIIKKSGKASIAVFSMRKSPLLGVSIIHPEDGELIYGLGARVESLLVGGEILVEVGEHLYIVEKTLKDAFKAASKVLGGTS
jgi:hypothetical protein